MVKTTVPSLFGNVIVLSAVGSVKTSVVSLVSLVPSIIILLSDKYSPDTVGLVIVGLVKVLFVSVCIPEVVATLESMAIVTADEPL